MDNNIEEILCFVCFKKFSHLYSSNNFLQIYEQHLLKNHSVVIPQFVNIENFLSFHKKIESFFTLQSTSRYSKITFNRLRKSWVYFVVDKEEMADSYIQKIIEKDFLEKILNQVQDERENKSFSRMCLFCKKLFKKDRALLFTHLFRDHNFFIGHPDNIVDSNEFLNLLEEKLKNLICLYCDKEFKSWNVLKEHMRKKGHKMLNPNNHEYDKFYLINYLYINKHWKQIKKENDFYIDDFNDFSDWVEDDRLDCLCFFCQYKNKFEDVKNHMSTIHNFDFDQVFFLQNFYDRIKTINFIRKRVNSCQCHFCDLKFDDKQILLNHLIHTQHISELPSKELLTAEYYFSSIEEDCFLIFLDEFNDI